MPIAITAAQEIILYTSTTITANLSKLYTRETKIIFIASNCDVSSFLEETVKGKRRNLRDAFKKELKKGRKYRSGDQAEAFRYKVSTFSAR
jgi:hypothetical protein